MKKQLHEISPRSARTAAPPPVPLSSSTGAVMSLDDLPGEGRSQHVEESLERTVLTEPQAEPPKTAETLSPSVPVPPPAKPLTKMIATPIDAHLRQRVRELRGQYEISEAFVVETALRAFLADRPLADVAAELRARGGRLRRSR